MPDSRGVFSKHSTCIFLFFTVTRLCSLDANACKLQGQNFLRRVEVLIVCEKVCRQVLCFLRISKKWCSSSWGMVSGEERQAGFDPGVVDIRLAFPLRISLCVSRETWGQSYDPGLSWWDLTVRVSKDGTFILEKLHGPAGSSRTGGFVDHARSDFRSLSLVREEPVSPLSVHLLHSFLDQRNSWGPGQFRDMQLKLKLPNFPQSGKTEFWDTQWKKRHVPVLYSK